MGTKAHAHWIHGLHTAIDLAGDLQKFAVMTDGKMHDVKAAKHFLHFD